MIKRIEKLIKIKMVPFKKMKITLNKTFIQDQIASYYVFLEITKLLYEILFNKSLYF